MPTWLKIGAVAIAAAALFFGGYRYAAALYQADIDELKASHAMALAEKEKENRANERKQNEALSAAWEEVERQKAELAESRADSGSLRIELERVRVESNRYRKRLSAAGANPASILQSDSTAVSDYSLRVRDWLLKVQKFLSESQESTTP